MKVSSLGRAARSKAGIKVRQPLAEAIITVRSELERKSIERISAELREELNVKEVKVSLIPEENWAVTFEVKPNLRLLRLRYGEKVPEVIDALSNADDVKVAASVIARQKVNIGKYSIPPQEINLVINGKPGYSAAYDGSYIVAVTTELPRELIEEGVAREIVRRLQTMRRSAGFDIADHITTYYRGDDYIKQVMTNKKLADYIKQETLSQQLVEGVPEKDAFTESHRLSGHEITLGVKRLG
ncbi:Isoleucine--tRNA ligase [subsurface metagenome]